MHTMTASISNSTYLERIQGTELPPSAIHLIDTVVSSFHQIPGSAIIIRYIRSSYKNDPVRSLVELFLVIFAVRYLLAPSYSTKRTNTFALAMRRSRS